VVEVVLPAAVFLNAPEGLFLPGGKGFALILLILLLLVVVVVVVVVVEATRGG